MSQKYHQNIHHANVNVNFMLKIVTQITVDD